MLLRTSVWLHLYGRRRRGKWANMPGSLEMRRRRHPSTRPEAFQLLASISGSPRHVGALSPARCPSGVRSFVSRPGRPRTRPSDMAIAASNTSGPCSVLPLQQLPSLPAALALLLLATAQHSLNVCQSTQSACYRVSCPFHQESSPTRVSLNHQPSPARTTTKDTTSPSKPHSLRHRCYGQLDLFGTTSQSLPFDFALGADRRHNVEHLQNPWYVSPGARQPATLP